MFAGIFGERGRVEWTIRRGIKSGKQSSAEPIHRVTPALESCNRPCLLRLYAVHRFEDAHLRIKSRSAINFRDLPYVSQIVKTPFVEQVAQGDAPKRRVLSSAPQRSFWEVAQERQ